MNFSLTQNHYNMFQHVMTVMEPFYMGNLKPIFSDIAQSYSVPHTQVDAAIKIISKDNMTAPVWETVNFIKSCTEMLAICPYIHKANPNPKQNEVYIRQLTLTSAQQDRLAHIIDVYSRLHSGQFQYILSELDIPANMSDEDLRHWENLFRNGLHWNKARSLLIPACSDLSWNSSLGITSKALSDNGRFTYEMSRIMRRPDDFVILTSGFSVLLGDDRFTRR